MDENMTLAVAEKASDSRAAIDKAISLLVAFGSEARSGLGVSELARRANLSKSTAFRVLSALERNAMVEKEGTHYRLGAGLHELGRAVYAPAHDNLRDLLLPYLTELFELTKQTVHLATLHGTDVVYLAKLYRHRSVPAPSRIGGRLPATCTAVGKVMLAYTAEAANAALQAPLPRMTPRSITDAASLNAELQNIRASGIAVDRGESQLNLTCVAAPVMVRGARPLAAMSISAPNNTDVRTLSGHLRRVCASAAQVLTRAGLADTA